MLPQAFQPGEVRDNNDNIVSPGAYGKNTPLVTADNQGILDYIINNFAAIKQLVESTKQDVESVNNGLIQSINGVSTVNGGAVDLSSVFLRNDGSNSAYAIRVPAYTIARLNNAGSLDICGGTGYKEGAYLSLEGKDSPQSTGAFSLGTNNHIFYGSPNGSLTWDNKHIVRKVHGAYADSNGAVNIPNATQSQSGLMPKLSGNANDVMTGTGAWWNRTWKQAFSGDFTTLNGVVCTLPANWQECIILYLDNQENYARKRSTPIIPRSCIDIEIWAGQGTAYEMGYKINTSNQLIMTHRGISSDAKIQYAYYR